MAENLSAADNWRAHRTLPAVEYLQTQTKVYSRLVEMILPGGDAGTIYCRSHERGHTRELAQETGPLQMWHPDAQEIQALVGDKICPLRSMEYKHTAVGSPTQSQNTTQPNLINLQDIYNCYLRHGWPNAFNKGACRKV